MASHAAVAHSQGGVGGGGRRRRARLEAALDPQLEARIEARSRSRTTAWAPKWRKLLIADGAAPTDFTEFDRTVRGMLNRISTENASRLLPLEPSLRGGELEASGDCPQWWAARFAALMLNSYLQVIHTNRFARGLAVRSADNVLPEYLDAVAPLLAQSPRLVTALMAWFANQLNWHDLCWSTSRLLLLAGCEDRDREALPNYSLGRLPAEIVRGRILSFLKPPSLPAATGVMVDCPLWDISPGVVQAQASPGAHISSPASPPSPQEPSDKRDIVAVLVHVIMFTPATIWPRLSAFGMSLAEACLANLDESQDVQVQIYLAASVITAIAQRIETKAIASSSIQMNRYRLEEIGPLSRLASLLEDVTDKQRQAETLSRFVDCRTLVALEHVQRLEETFQRHFDGAAPKSAMAV